jgi:hypothetical protein
MERLEIIKQHISALRYLDVVHVMIGWIIATNYRIVFQYIWESGVVPRIIIPGIIPRDTIRIEEAHYGKSRMDPCGISKRITIIGFGFII